jgi:serine phosphatase RsbU (regulator of sigma subunit)
MLAIPSDGVFDARSPTGDQFEAPRVISFFERHRAAPAQVQLDALRQELLAWQGKDDPVDDQTIIIVTREG